MLKFIITIELRFYPLSVAILIFALGRQRLSLAFPQCRMRQTGFNEMRGPDISGAGEIASGVLNMNRIEGVANHAY